MINYLSQRTAVVITNETPTESFITKQMDINVDSLQDEAANHRSLRTTGLYHRALASIFFNFRSFNFTDDSVNTFFHFQI